MNTILFMLLGVTIITITLSIMAFIMSIYIQYIHTIFGETILFVFFTLIGVMGIFIGFVFLIIFIFER